MTELPTWDRLDALVDTDPMALRDIGAQLSRRLNDTSDTILGVVENGPWVLIPDPALRELVGRHVGDACRAIADDAGLDEVAKQAAQLRGPGALPTELPKES